MDRQMFFAIGICVLFLAGACWFCYEHIRMVKLLGRLDSMVESALEGTFSETVYDESQVSSLEVRMGQYLKKQAGQERKLREEQEAVHTLISDISHQTKTPVANLILYSQLLEEEPLCASAKELADQLLFQSEKLRFLTESLFKTAALERGMIVLSPKRHPVRELVTGAVSQAGPKASQKGINIQWKLQRPEDQALFDVRWTQEALWNILDNAVKYTYEGDTIFLEGAAYEFFYRITVTDHGPGIPEEEIPKIFQRFYRSGQAQEKEGVGIGLYLASEILRTQGGYIKASCGKETSFSLFLPRNEREKILQNC